MKPRPWRQSKSGAVRAVRSRTLRGVGLSAKRFKLGAGKSRRVYVTMGSVPSRGSLYGALEAVGKPQARLGRERRVPARGQHALQPVLEALHACAPGPRAPRAACSAMLVRNAGNTADAVGGRVRITGGGGAWNGTATAVRILPGKLVRVKLGSTRSAAPGDLLRAHHARPRAARSG